MHSTPPKIGKNAKFVLSKFFDFGRRCTARRQKSENLPSFTAEIPPHSEIPEKITNGEDYMNPLLLEIAVNGGFLKSVLLKVSDEIMFVTNF